ncbi:hypothetical protein [Thermocrinis sp.]
MSYSEIAELILKLKGEVFLSPRERWFLKRLEEEKYPLEVVKKGIEKFYASIPPERRQKTPAFLALKHIQQIRKRTIPRQKVEDWEERFKRKLERLKQFIQVPEVNPKSKVEAEEVLMELEQKLYKHIWEHLPEEEKREILRKYAQFKKDKTALSFMVKGELRKKFNLEIFSLFVEEK